MDKEEFRRRLRTQRKKLSLEEVQVKSELVISRLITVVSWQEIKNLHVYQPIASLGEINTEPLLKYLSDSAANVRVTIQSRTHAAAADDQKFDLIIVPTLGFDSDCHRLGWGGGWYDRFLAAQPQAKKIGLAYQSSFIEQCLPIEPHDIGMDIIITEESIINSTA